MDDAAHLDRVAVEEASVVGWVNMTPARSSSASARTASRSMSPPDVEGTETTWKPAMAAEAGFVPWAVSGMSILRRLPSPRASSAARRVRTPASSPCAPASGARLTPRQAADLLEVHLQAEDGFQRSLHLSLRLCRMGEREPRRRGDCLVQLGVVLHRATAEGVEVSVYGEVQLAEVGEVADDLALRDLRQLQVISEHRLLRHELGRYVGRGEGHAGTSGAAALHEQPAAVVRFLAERGVGHGGHWPISASAATRRSIWARVLTSVTQSNMPFG